MEGAKRYATHYNEGLKEVWLRDLDAGKAKMVERNPLGILGFAPVKRDGVWRMVVDGSAVVPDIVNMAWE